MRFRLIWQQVWSKQNENRNGKWQQGKQSWNYKYIGNEDFIDTKWSVWLHEQTNDPSFCETNDVLRWVATEQTWRAISNQE